MGKSRVCAFGALALWGIKQRKGMPPPLVWVHAPGGV